MAHRVLDDLHQDLLAVLERVGDAPGALLALRRRDLVHVEEAVLLEAEVDEGRVDAAHDVLDLALVDVAQVRLAVGALDVDLREPAVLDQRDAQLLAVVGDQDDLALGTLGDHAGPPLSQLDGEPWCRARCPRPGGRWPGGAGGRAGVRASWPRGGGSRGLAGGGGLGLSGRADLSRTAGSASPASADASGASPASAPSWPAGRLLRVRRPPRAPRRRRLASVSPSSAPANSSPATSAAWAEAASAMAAGSAATTAAVGPAAGSSAATCDAAGSPAASSASRAASSCSMSALLRRRRPPRLPRRRRLAGGSSPSPSCPSPSAGVAPSGSSGCSRGRRGLSRRGGLDRSRCRSSGALGSPGLTPRAAAPAPAGRRRGTGRPRPGPRPRRVRRPLRPVARPCSPQPRPCPLRGLRPPPAAPTGMSGAVGRSVAADAAA